MFRRVSALEVWIEHAVSKDEVRNFVAAEPAPHADASVTPEAVNHDGIVFRSVLSDPLVKMRAVEIPREGRTGAMYRSAPARDPIRLRLAQGDQLSTVPQTIERDGKLARGFHAATQGRVDIANTLQNIHWGLRSRYISCLPLPRAPRGLMRVSLKFPARCSRIYDSG